MLIVSTVYPNIPSRLSAEHLNTESFELPLVPLHPFIGPFPVSQAGNGPVCACLKSSIVTYKNRKVVYNAMQFSNALYLTCS